MGRTDQYRDRLPCPTDRTEIIVVTAGSLHMITVDFSTREIRITYNATIITMNNSIGSDQTARVNRIIRAFLVVDDAAACMKLVRHDVGAGTDTDIFVSNDAANGRGGQPLNSGHRRTGLRQGLVSSECQQANKRNEPSPHANNSF